MYTPKNALLLKCIDQIVLNVSNNYYGENPLCITGPALVGKLFILEKYDLKLVDIEHTRDGKLAYKNKVFGTMYRQYREEQRGNFKKEKEQNVKHYSELWNLKEVY